jgi:NADPH2:quinone reductase
MRAVVVDRLMEPRDLVVREIDAPAPGPGEVAIDVRAAGCNFSDVLMLRGAYQVRPPLPFVPGREAAGIVAAVGEGVSRCGPGDRVLAFTDLGAFAERVVVPAAEVHRMPDAMSFEHGAAIPIVYPTAHAALVDRAGIRAGETLLVHAAAGATGLAAVQIGRALGARVIATAGGEDKLAVAREAGADVAIDYREQDFVPVVLERTGDRGADVIFDPVGGDTTDRSLKCIAWKGRLLVVGFAGGHIPEIRANRIMLKNISVVGLHWPAYADHEPATVGAIFDDLMALYARGAIEPRVQASYPLEQAGAALAALQGRRTVGKVLVRP